MLDLEGGGEAGRGLPVHLVLEFTEAVDVAVVDVDLGAHAQADEGGVGADAIFAEADLIVKVKEPQPEEVARLRPGQVLFTYLHLAP
ncbi:MAG: hypothetical protein ACKOTH_06540, partial [Solirubrobacterales bacterium]